jgi:hypothetical protein
MRTMKIGTAFLVNRERRFIEPSRGGFIYNSGVKLGSSETLRTRDIQLIGVLSDAVTTTFRQLFVSSLLQIHTMLAVPCIKHH